MEASPRVPQAFVDLYDHIRGPECMPIPDSLIDKLDAIGQELLDYGFNLASRLPNLRGIPNQPRRPIRIDAEDTIHRLRLIIPECHLYGIDLQEMLSGLLAMADKNARPVREVLCCAMQKALQQAEKMRQSADQDVSEGQIDDLITRLLAET